MAEISVDVTTLDQFCAAHSVDPDCVLIDIEGFEIAALRGAEELIRRRGSRLLIVVEMHPSLWPSANTSADQASALFESLRLRAVPLTGQRDALRDYGIIALEAL
jgi:hypothetical protein